MKVPTQPRPIPLGLGNAPGFCKRPLVLRVEGFDTRVFCIFNSSFVLGSFGTRV